MRYRHIHPCMFRDVKFIKLSDDARLVWMLISFGPYTTSVPGLYCAGLPALADELRWPVDRFEAAFGELERGDMVRYDRDARVVWIPSAVEDASVRNPNQVRSWRTSIQELRRTGSALLDDALQHIGSYLQALSAALSRVFEEVSGLRPTSDPPSRCLRNNADPVPDPGSDPDQAPVRPLALLQGGRSTPPPEPETPPPSRPKGEPSGSTPPAPTGVERVVEHYREYHAHARISPRSPECRLIAERLAEGFAPDDLCRAIDGNHLSAWHCGENPDRRQYHSLGLIFRTADKVAGFIEIADTHQKMHPPARPAEPEKLPDRDRRLNLAGVRELMAQILGPMRVGAGATA